MCRLSARKITRRIRAKASKALVADIEDNGNKWDVNEETPTWPEVAMLRGGSSQEDKTATSLKVELLLCGDQACSRQGQGTSSFNRP